MTEVVVFHHAQGLTPGVQRFAEQLREAGHRVTVPDLYEGRTFDSLEAGVAHAGATGFDTILERGRAAVEGLPSELVYAGFSLGVMPAQMLTQTRPGARGALFYYACLPPSEFEQPWPEGVPVQIHGMDRDTYFADEGDLDAARGLDEAVEGAELFLYPGDQHLFADSSLPAYDEAAASLLMERTLAFLSRLP